MARPTVPQTSQPRKQRTGGAYAPRTSVVSETVLIDTVVALDQAERAAALAQAAVARARAELVADANAHLGRGRAA